jgi:hypothetical protein
MPLLKIGDYRWLTGRTVVHGLHPALVDKGEKAEGGDKGEKGEGFT